MRDEQRGQALSRRVVLGALAAFAWTGCGGAQRETEEPETHAPPEDEAAGEPTWELADADQGDAIEGERLEGERLEEELLEEELLEEELLEEELLEDELLEDELLEDELLEDELLEDELLEDELLEDEDTYAPGELSCDTPIGPQAQQLRTS